MMGRGKSLHLLADVILSLFFLLLVEFEDVEPTGSRGLAVCNPHLFPNPIQLRNLKFMSGLVEHFGEIHISL